MEMGTLTGMGRSVRMRVRVSGPLVLLPVPVPVPARRRQAALPTWATLPATVAASHWMHCCLYARAWPR